jgi:drug/metabolite transporter (DMT)-like permease
VPPPARRDPIIDIADAAMLLVALVWAGNNLIVKDAVGAIAPLAYVLGRFAIVVALLFPWLRWRGANLRVRRADWPPLLLSGLSGFAVYNALFTVGLARTSAFSVALLVSLGPVCTLLLAAGLGLERIRPGQWLGVAVAVAGDALGLLAAVSFSVYSLATRPLVARYGSPVVTAWSALVGLVAVLPFALPAALRQDWVGIGVWGWRALLYSSALSMLAAYTVWGWAIGRRGIGRTVPYLYLVPVVTGVAAAPFLGEAFGPAKLVGAALVLLGLVLTQTLGRLSSPSGAGTAEATVKPVPDLDPSRYLRP